MSCTEIDRTKSCLLSPAQLSGVSVPGCVLSHRAAFTSSRDGPARVLSSGHLYRRARSVGLPDPTRGEGWEIGLRLVCVRPRPRRAAAPRAYLTWSFAV